MIDFVPYLCFLIIFVAHKQQRIMFTRNTLKGLQEWAARPGHKPLVLRGARQVGKTTLVNQFAQTYEVYLKLNLEKPEDRRLFEMEMSMEERLSSIYLLNNRPRKNVPTLLFIDEIQNSPQAVSMLRYFYEEVPQLDVIAAGSLLESLIDKHIPFPVGRVEYMAVRPCSFNEFLGAINETGLQTAQQQFEIPEALHEKTARLFGIFALIGGMPEVVNHYAAHQDIVALKHIYETLLTGYRDDVEKYAENANQRDLLRHILNVGWFYAGQRISFEKFGNSLYRSRPMSEAFRMLEKTMLLELIYPISSTAMPMVPETRRSPKLLWLDAGLSNYAGGLQKSENLLKLSDDWTGHMAEQMVGQELLGNDNVFSHKRHFWVNGSGSDAEVDFVLPWEDKIIPIEVKSGHNAHLRSLHQFMNKAPHDIALRFWNKAFSIDRVSTPQGKTFRLFNLPYYYAGQVPLVLQKATQG